MTSLRVAQLLLAAGTNEPNSQGQEFGSAGPIALILIICLFIAVAFLIRSMTKHLKRVPASFDPPEEQATTPEMSAEFASETEPEKQDH